MYSKFMPVATFFLFPTILCCGGTWYASVA